MKPWVLIATILLICACVVLCKDECVHYDVNGCSIPFKMPFFYKERFTHACNLHDVCYRCGSQYGIPRGVCDLAFLDAMKQTCLNLRKRRATDDGRGGHVGKRSLERGLCELIAQGYYKAVDEFGSSTFRVPSNPYCKEIWWVLPCLPHSYSYDVNN